MVASGNGHTPFMRFLLEEGVEPGIANETGEFAKGYKCRNLIRTPTRARGWASLGLIFSKYYYPN